MLPLAAIARTGRLFTAGDVFRARRSTPGTGVGAVKEIPVRGGQTIHDGQTVAVRE